MQVIIDIDENVFTRLFDNGTEDYAIVNDDLFAIAKSIRLCIPLDRIRAEIDSLADSDAFGDYQRGFNYGARKAVQIINKYKEGSHV